jgi:ATP-dependent Clp protease protease subunit
MGKAMSAGAILLSHGDYRFVAPFARVMIHEVSGGVAGNINDVTSDAAEMARLNNKFMELFAKNCEIKGGMKGLKKLFKEGRDLYLTAEQAVELGVADSIGVPRLTRISQWVLDTSTPKGE